MWSKKGQTQQTPIPENNHDEFYTVVRARALKSRESTPSGETHADMKVLYEFWSHFLCRNFNPTMYTEFHHYACEDAKENAMDGMMNLVSYYDEVLTSTKKVIPDILALHYVAIAKEEKSSTKPPGERLALSRLRLAWRNGALDLKSRKKIDNLIDQPLRDELER
jgi:la-related protein 1